QEALAALLPDGPGDGGRVQPDDLHLPPTERFRGEAPRREQDASGRRNRTVFTTEGRRREADTSRPLLSMAIHRPATRQPRQTVDGFGPPGVLVQPGG